MAITRFSQKRPPGGRFSATPRRALGGPGANTPVTLRDTSPLMAAGWWLPRQHPAAPVSIPALSRCHRASARKTCPAQQTAPRAPGGVTSRSSCFARHLGVPRANTLRPRCRYPRCPGAMGQAPAKPARRSKQPRVRRVASPAGHPVLHTLFWRPRACGGMPLKIRP